MERKRPHKPAAGSNEMETSRAKRAKTAVKQDQKQRFPTDFEIKKLSLGLTDKWKMLGTLLNITVDHMDRISENHESVQDKIAQMLTDWRLSYAGGDAYAILSEALKDEMVGRWDLAEQVKVWTLQHAASRPPSVQTGTPETAQLGTSSNHAASGSSSSTKIELQEPDKPVNKDQKQPFPTDFEIKKLSLSLSKRWTVLGTLLGIEDDHIKRINGNHKVVEDKIDHMLKDWRQGKAYAGGNIYATLSEALKDEMVGRSDLAEQVEVWALQHAASRPPSVQTGTPETAQLGMSSNHAASGSSSSTKIELQEADKPEMSSDHAASGSSSPVEIEIQESDKPDSSGDTSGQDPSPPFSEYPMKHNPRGLCVIINNEKFIDGIQNRTGSNIDEGKLKELFQILHFDVQVEKNNKADKMIKVLKDAREIDHSQYDCFACCILSHGGNGQISGTDGESVKIQNILQHFKDVKSLNGKPKLFFFQACQGSKPQHGVQTDEDINEDVGIGAQITVPKEADFLISYSTVSGYVSYRDPAKGTWYVNDLVEVFAKNHTKKDLLTMLTEVNKLLSTHTTSKDGKDCYQVGAICSTLRKSVNLRDFST